MQIVDTGEPIYKRDTKGKVREWKAETGTDGDRWAWRTIAGLQDGQKVTSGWTFVEEKNVGRANATSLPEQARLELEAEYTKKLDRGYFIRLDAVDTFDKFKPMLAQSFDDHVLDFEQNVYCSQPKLDGIRCIARRDGLWTRQGKEIVAVPHIAKYLKVFFEKNPDAILDGELYNHDLKDDFNKITSMVRKAKPIEADIAESAKLVQYHIYDCIMPKNEDTILYGENPFFRDRHGFMWGQGFSNPVHYVPTRTVYDRESLDRLYGEYLEAGYEGQMVRLDAVYENKRSKYLLKRKEFLTDEFKVVSMEEGLGNWAGHTKRFVLLQKNGNVFGAGVRGNQETLKALWEGKNTPNWVTCRYFTPTPDGVPRFPVVVDWGYGERED